MTLTQTQPAYNHQHRDILASDIDRHRQTAMTTRTHENDTCAKNAENDSHGRAQRNNTCGRIRVKNHSCATTMDAASGFQSCLIYGGINGCMSLVLTDRRRRMMTSRPSIRHDCATHYSHSRVNTFDSHQNKNTFIRIYACNYFP